MYYFASSHFVSPSRFIVVVFFVLCILFIFFFITLYRKGTHKKTESTEKNYLKTKREIIKNQVYIQFTIKMGFTKLQKGRVTNNKVYKGQKET